MRYMVIHFFKRQLHIAIIIRIVNIVAPIMHGQKIDKAEISIIVLMFFKVLEQNRQFEQLYKKAIVQANQKYKYVYGQFFHTTKLESPASENKSILKFNL